MTPRVAVVVPVHDQAAFLPRALGSLLAQDVRDWEAVVVDDGSSDDVRSAVPDDARIRVVRHDANRGLGAALNTGLRRTSAPLIAYLPADDAWYPDHLARLLPLLEDAPLEDAPLEDAPPEHGVREDAPLEDGPCEGAVLATTGVQWAGGVAHGPVEGHGLQLVQVAHRRTGDTWTERDELESDDLGLLLLDRLPGHVRTGVVTCAWTDHPHQRHKRIRERYDGGVNVFRRAYRVPEPLRLHSSDSGLTDERALYERFAQRVHEPSADGLRVLVAGELCFNPERLLALVERGHALLGHWTDQNLGSQYVGPLPFGHVRDVDAVDRREVDVVYALLSWRAVPFAAALRRRLPGVPFVWHMKESPQACIRSGTWSSLVELCAGADEVLFSTDEERDWMHLALPGRLDPARVGVVDGDLPKADWFTGEPSPRLSDADGQVHTAVLGRPLGVDAGLLTALGRAGVHVHLHGQVDDRGPAAGWRAQVEQARRAVPGFVHVHPRVDQRGWVRVLSRYDAGWLHRLRSSNGGDLRRAGWDDLNAPARLPTYAAAGLPVLQQRSRGCVVAVERLVGEAGVLFDDVDHLVQQLHDGVTLGRARQAQWRDRARFTFDAWTDDVVAALRRAVARRG